MGKKQKNRQYPYNIRTLGPSSYGNYSSYGASQREQISDVNAQENQSLDSANFQSGNPAEQEREVLSAMQTIVPERHIQPGSPMATSSIIQERQLGITSPDAQQAMEEPLAPEQKALAQAERTISARDFLSGGGGRGIRDAQYAPTQQDLYPQQNDVLIGQTRGVGKYGRAPIFYGGNNILPLGVVGGKMKAIADERKKLEDAAKGLNLTEGLEKLNNPNYEAVRNQWVRDSIQSEYAKFRDFYGDDVELRAALNTPGTAAHRAFYGPGGVIDSINTVSKQANQIFAETEAVIEGMTGPEAEMEMDEDLLNRAYAVREGLQGNGDIRKLAKDWRSLQAVLNVDRFVKDNKLTELYEKAVKESTKTTGPTTIHIRGGRVVKFDKNTSSEQIREQLVDAVASNPAFRGQVSRERVEKLFPLYEKTEVDWKLMQDKAPSGSSGSGADAPKYRFTAGLAPQHQTEYSPMQVSMRPAETVMPTEDVAGKQRPLGVLMFETPTGSTLNMAGARLQKKFGKWYVVGVAVGDKFVNETKSVMERFQGGAEIADIEKQLSGMGVTREIPYEGNELRWKGYMGPDFDPERIYQEQTQAQGGSTQPQSQVPQTSTKPPKPGAKFINGKWWEKVNGQIVEVK